ncbi:unannotated protein [freshwater metagenome]|uniref:Unannotated protein n=1 Tax=freshwater metagenome TaxID=449393 RepID=A0A6J6DIE7_9ZZZZ
MAKTTCSLLTLPRRPRPAASTLATSLVTPTWICRPVTSACAAKRFSIRWDGTTTAFRQNAGFRTITACGVTPLSPMTTPSFRLSTPAKLQMAQSLATRCQSAGVTSLNCAKSSRWRTNNSLRISGEHWASAWTGVSPTARLMITHNVLPSVPSWAIWSGAKPTEPTRQHCGTSPLEPRWLRRSSRIENSPRPTTRCDSMARPNLMWSLSRPDQSSFPPVWLWLRTPMMSATNPSSDPLFAPPCSMWRSRFLLTTWPSKTREPGLPWSAPLAM